MDLATIRINDRFSLGQTETGRQIRKERLRGQRLLSHFLVLTVIAPGATIVQTRKKQYSVKEQRWSESSPSFSGSSLQNLCCCLRVLFLGPYNEIGPNQPLTVLRYDKVPAN
jgi:hypothetical protein